MSISIGYRAIFTAFGHSSSALRGHTPSKQAPLPAQTEAPVSIEGGELKCSPWEGLYLEQAQPLTAKGNELAVGRQLDAFLASLMYGE